MSDIQDALLAVGGLDIPQEQWDSLLSLDIGARKPAVDYWTSQQQYLKGEADARTAQVQALALLSSPANIEAALGLEDAWNKKHPGQQAPAGIAVPTALREAYNKFRVQQVEADAKVKTANELLGITPDEFKAAAADPAKMAALLQQKAPNAKTAEAKEALANYQATVELGLKSFQLKSAQAEMEARIADAKGKSNVLADLFKKYHVGTGAGDKSLAAAAQDGTLLNMLTEATNAEDQAAVQVLSGARDVLVKYQTIDAEVKKIKLDAEAAQGPAADGLSKSELADLMERRAKGHDKNNKPYTAADELMYNQIAQAQLKTSMDTLSLRTSAEFQPFVDSIAGGLNGNLGHPAAAAVGAVLGAKGLGNPGDMVSGGFTGTPGATDPGTLIGMVTRGDIASLRALPLDPAGAQTTVPPKVVKGGPSIAP